MRSNRAIALSGCFLHQSLMAVDCEAAPASIKPVVRWALKNDIGLIPWTCPETMFAGLPRKPKGIERYRREGFEDTCEVLAKSFAEYISIQIAGGITILALVGVSFSPACSVRRQAYHANELGLFMSALTKALSSEDVPLIDIHRTKAPEIIKKELDNLLKPFRLM